MESSPNSNPNNHKKTVHELRPSSALWSLYGNIWDNLNGNTRISGSVSVTTIFIKKVKDNITKLVPEAGKTFIEVDYAFSSLEKKGKNVQRDSYINKSIEITIEIMSRYLSWGEIESRLKKIEQKV